MKNVKWYYLKGELTETRPANHWCESVNLLEADFDGYTVLTGVIDSEEKYVAIVKKDGKIKKIEIDIFAFQELCWALNARNEKIVNKILGL